MTDDKIVNMLSKDSRITKLQMSNAIIAVNLQHSIKEDEKQLRKFIHSDKNFNGCIVTGLLIKDLLITIKDKKDELYSLPDNVIMICKQLLNISIYTKPKRANDELINFY